MPRSSAPISRAVETVAIAFPDTDVPVRSDRRLRECDYGELNGAAIDRLVPRARFITTAFPRGESYRDVVERVGGFLRDLEPYDGLRVLIVGHSATRWALDHVLTGRALEDLVDAPFEWQPGWLYRMT